MHIPLIIEQLPDFQTAQRVATDEFRYKQAFEKLANSYVSRGEGGGSTHQRFGTKLAKRVLTFFDDKERIFKALSLFIAGRNYLNPVKAYENNS